MKREMLPLEIFIFFLELFQFVVDVRSMELVFFQWF